MLKTEHFDDNLSRVYTYYGGVSAGVPFLWESKPGTPKHSTSNTSLPDKTSSSLFPPLNPPPCYYRIPPQTPMGRRSKSFALRNLFSIKIPILICRKKSRHSDRMLPPESLSPSSSSSASSVPSSPIIRPLKIFRRSQSTLVRHNKSMFDYDFSDEKTASISPFSRGSTRCFWH